MNKRNTAHARFFTKYKIDTDTGCWNWTGYLYHGYGILSVARKPTKAHRVSYEIHHGAIPSGMIICHRCDNRSCVNPDHLFVGTYKDNNQDIVDKGRHYLSKRTHCDKGHAYTPENTYQRTPSSRRCRTCDRDYQREYQRELRKARRAA